MRALVQPHRGQWWALASGMPAAHRCYPHPLHDVTSAQSTQMPGVCQGDSIQSPPIHHDVYGVPVPHPCTCMLTQHIPRHAVCCACVFYAPQCTPTLCDCNCMHVHAQHASVLYPFVRTHTSIAQHSCDPHVLDACPCARSHIHPPCTPRALDRGSAPLVPFIGMHQTCQICTCARCIHHMRTMNTTMHHLCTWHVHNKCT